jgi:hypothetical protein
VTSFRFAAPLLLIGAALLLLGCKSEADKRREDKAMLEMVIVEDVKASNAMGEAEKASRKGDVIGALDALDSRAKPAVESGLRIAGTQNPSTDWGRTKKASLTKVLEDRKAELGPYREALASNDKQKLIDSLETQQKIETRALALVVEVNEGR